MADAKRKAVFAVRLEAAMRVEPFISTEETRYYLNGIFIEPAADGGAVCVATDGHRLGVRFDKEGLCVEPTIVRIPAEIKLPKSMLGSPWLVGISTAPGKGFVAVVDPAAKRDGDTATNAIERVEDCTIRIGHAFIDGTFPDWRRVVPAPTEGDVIRGFNAKYIRAFGEQMTLRGANASSPHLVEMACDPLFIGVLMPMRTETKGKLPDWLAAPKVERKKAA